MPVRIADSMKQMNDLSSFPVAYGEDIWLDKNKGSGTPNYDSIQNMYNNDELGGGGSSIQVDTMPIASEHPNEIVQFVGESGSYQTGFFYQSISDEQNPPTYSWVQKNVQPSNATATDVSYDNTTSELVATNVQDAIDEIKGGLGSASGKNFTDLVRPNSHELVESGSVYSAINNALSSIYTPRGELTCAELTSSLLIEDNVGNIYTMSDSGTTSALFINGAGQTINVNDNVGIIKAGPNTYLFNLMGDAFDLHDYQKKELSSGAMIEDVIPSNANINNKLVAKSDVEKDMIASSSSIQSLQALLDDVQPQNWGAGTYQGALVINGWGVGTYQMTKTDNTSANHKTVIYGTFSTASDGARPFVATYTSSNVWNIVYLTLKTEVVTKFDVTIDATSNPIDDIKTVVNQLVNMSTKTTTYCGSIYRRSSGGIQGCFGNYDISVYIVDSGAYAGNTHINGTLTFGMGGNSNVEDTYSVSCSIDVKGSGETYWNIGKLATTDNLTRVLEGDYQLQTGGDNYVWFDLGTSPNTANSQAYLFYEITYGRVDGLQSKILVSCGGTMADGNYIKIVNLNNAQTSASEQFKVDSNKHLWLGMQSYCDAHVKVYGRWSGMGGKTTVEPIGTLLSISKCITTSDVTSTVTSESTAPVTSGGVYSYIKSNVVLVGIDDHDIDLDLRSVCGGDICTVVLGAPAQFNYKAYIGVYFENLGNHISWIGDTPPSNLASFNTSTGKMTIVGYTRYQILV